MSRALITGLPGFVGGHLAEHLLHAGDAVLGAAPQGAWEPHAPVALRGRVELVAWDVGRDDGLAPAALRRIEQFAPDCIYHLAAVSVPADCGHVEPLPPAVGINVAGTRRAMELAAALPGRPRVLLASTCHVYAPPPPGAPQVSEDAPLGPQSAYGRTKLAAEQIVQAAVAAGGDAVICRSFQHTGPRQGPRMMLPQWAQQFAAGAGPIAVHTRDAWMDLSDVRDAARAYRLVMEQGARGGVYNVGTGVAVRSGDVLELLRQLAGPTRPIVETAPRVKHEPIAALARIAAATGWRAEIPLAQTVADTWAWWQTAARS
jgi:GDP-4-dehydro-6-deoxy-D-mannose reductase